MGYCLYPGNKCGMYCLPIADHSECYDAALAMGYEGDAVSHTEYLDYVESTEHPQGCFKDGGNGRFQFNPSKLGGVGTQDDQILCKCTIPTPPSIYDIAKPTPLVTDKPVPALKPTDPDTSAPVTTSKPTAPVTSTPVPTSSR